MRTIKTWLATIAVLLCSLTASAHDFKVDGIYYDIISSTDLTVAVAHPGVGIYSLLNEYSGAISIPSSVTHNSKTYRVTKIEPSTFGNCVNLTSISIPEGVSSIGSRAFYGCSSLTSISIPEGVTKIEPSTFGNCVNLTSISIPEGVSSIGSSAFYGCSSLTSISIPEGVSGIGSSAFSGCSSLTSITIPEGMTSIEMWTFAGCCSLTTITIPDGVTEIKSYAFDGCVNLTSIAIPEGVSSIGREAFSGCSSLTSIVVAEGNEVFDSRNNCNAIIHTETNELMFGCASTIIPESVTSIALAAFRDCVNLTSIAIPAGVTSIGYNAFKGCSSLISITIPDGVTEIKSGTFQDCVNLTSIAIPASVTSIANGAFSGCSSLTSIAVAEGNEVFDSRNNCNAIVHTEGNVLMFGCASTIIPESVISIAGSAFLNCVNLTSITIPESVTTIYDDAFSGCNSLTSIVVAEGNEVFDSRNNCNAIIHTETNELMFGCASTIIPENVTSIASGAFQDCVNLTSIAIPGSVTSIGYDAFKGCSSLTSITIPDGVTEIRWCAFQDCVNLTSITIPESVTSIGDDVFSGCSSLTSFTIPEGVTSIGKEVFKGCNNLSELIYNASSCSVGSALLDEFSVVSLYVGKNVQSCGLMGMYNIIKNITVDPENPIYDSRNNCNAVIETATNKLVLGCSNTVIPSSVGILGIASFSSNLGLTSIVIPGNVGCLEPFVFSQCHSLSRIYIQGCPIIFSVGTFRNCYNLKSITCESLIPPSFHSVDGVEVPPFEGVPLDDCILYVPSEAIAAYKKAEYWKEFTNIQPIVKRDVEIQDNAECFEQEIDEECASITYTRNFKNTSWQALYVPFEIPYENIKDDFVVAYINDVHQFDDDDDGTIDRTQVEAIKVTGGVLKANYPYMIRAKVAGEKSITVADATLYATEENSIDCSSVFDTYTFTGTYSKIPASELPKEEGYYALSGGAWKQFSSGATSSLGAFRIYMKIDSRDANATVESRAIEMRVIGDDEEGATGVENPAFETQKSELIYDLQGRRVENPTKGLYIVDGRKVWIE